MLGYTDVYIFKYIDGNEAITRSLHYVSKSWFYWTIIFPLHTSYYAIKESFWSIFFGTFEGTQVQKSNLEENKYLFC